MGFPSRNDHFEVFWGYHHLRKTPIWVQHLIFFEDMFWEALCGTTTPLNQRWELSEAEGLSYHLCWKKMGVSLNGGTPKSSILLGFSVINHPFWGYPYFWKHPIRGERILKQSKLTNNFVCRILFSYLPFMVVKMQNIFLL